MAFEVKGPPYSLKAAADLTADQYRFVTVDGNGEVVLAGDGVRTLGVLQSKTALGEGASIVDRGITKVVAGAAVAINAAVSSDAAGKAKTSASGNSIEGRALTAAAADGDLISVKLDCEGLAP